MSDVSLIDRDGRTVFQGTQTGGGGSQTVLSATVTLDATTLATIGDDGCQLVAAPGSGKMIAPVALTMEYVAGGTPYTTPSGNLYVGGAEAGNWDPGVSDSILEGGSNTVVAVSVSQQNQNPFTASDADDQAILLWDDSGNMTDGDGTLVCTLVYYLVDLT